MRKITSWINEKYSVSLRDKDYSVLTEFLLLWNLFEAKLFANNFSIDQAEQFIGTNIDRFNLVSCNRIFNYFKNRYTNTDLNTITYPTFEKLNFRTRDREVFVQNVLMSNTSFPKDEMLASIIIIYRYRNNLFHGLKDVTQINYQTDNFVNANAFLKMYIEASLS